jgi:hypothetical protein
MHFGAIGAAVVVLSLVLFPIIPLSSQQSDPATIIQRIDAANHARYDNVLAYTDTEHYSVFRGKDQTHPSAEMTVKITYNKGVGKSYTVLSQGGSEVIHKFGLLPLLDHEKRINDPATVEKSWFTSENYQMKLKLGATRNIDGRDCIALAINPKHKAPNMIEGTLWVDANDNSIVEVDGIASRSPSVFAGTTKMMRRYTNISGYAMAAHARAESNSFLFGRTVVIIEYSGYQIQLRSTP